MKLLALSPADQQRLEKLAREAGRTPRAMMRFVLRDGFDYCEWMVRESLASEADVKRRGTVPHAEVRRMARAAIAASHERRPRKAA
jgi:predicted transcriptional regulator